MFVRHAAVQLWETVKALSQQADASPAAPRDSHAITRNCVTARLIHCSYMVAIRCTWPLGSLTRRISDSRLHLGSAFLAAARATVGKRGSGWRVSSSSRVLDLLLVSSSLSQGVPSDGCCVLSGVDTMEHFSFGCCLQMTFTKRLSDTHAGHRQLLSLAWAVLRKSRVMLLDEVTTHVAGDAAQELLHGEALAGATVLLIARKLESMER